MSFKVQCPGCSDKVVAEEADRGQTIKCGTCWTAVSIPAAEGGTKSSPVAKPMARLLPNLPAAAAVPATAVPAKPAPVTAAVAKPATAVVAAPVVAVPVAPPPKENAKKKKDKEKPRFKSRDRDDDDDEDVEDDDDTPGRKGKKKGNMGLLLGLGAVAVVLVAVCGGVGYWLMPASGTAAATTAPGDGGGGDGGGGGDPAKPKHWKPIAVGDGFAMDTPNGSIEKNDAKVMLGKDGLDGKKYWVRDANSTIQIAAIHCDLKGDALRRYNPTAMALEMFALPQNALVSKGPRYVGDREVSEFACDRVNVHDAIWVVKIADRAYGFQFHWENPEPAGVYDLKEAFFRSLALTYVGVEPFDPQPWNPGGPMPNPNVPAPIDQPWVALVNKAGFTAEAPKGARDEKQYLEINGKVFHGRKYWTEDGNCNYAVYFHDVPANSGVEFRQILTPLLPFPHSIGASADAKLDGKAATKWTLKHAHGGPGYAMSARSDFRVFTLIVTNKAGLHTAQDATHEERTEKFFKAFKINFDPKKADLLADEPAWAAMAKTVGFTALAPKGTNVADHSAGFGRDGVAGKEYKSEDEGMVFQVFTYDLPPGKTIDKIVTEHLARQKVTDGPKDITIDGNAAEEIGFADFFKLPIVLRSVKVGNRAIILKVSKRFGGGKVSDMEYDAKKAKFFANFRIGNGGGLPVENPNGDPMPNPGAAGEFVKAGKVLPFWASVVLPQKKELLTLSIRDATAAKPGGTIRRYGYPDFKLKATYQIALPVNWAVVDEKAGRLYCATVNAYDKTFSERELSFALGDIQILDLAKLTDGKYAELEDVKPLSTIPIGARISGLEISPEDSTVFVSAINQTKDKGKTVWRGRLYKIENEKKLPGDIECANAIWSMRLAAGGGKLYASEMPVTPAGQPILGIALPSNTSIVDTATWKRTNNLLMPAPAVEIALAADRVLAIVSSRAEPNLLAVDNLGDVADLTPKAEAMAGTRYMRTTPDGKKMLLSGGIGVNEANYYEVVAGAPPRLLRIAGGNQLDALPLGGHFTFSPDGKYALFNTGVIVDLEKSAGKK